MQQCVCRMYNLYVLSDSAQAADYNHAWHVCCALAEIQNETSCRAQKWTDTYTQAQAMQTF